MFATLLGPLPRPELPDDAPAEAILDAILGLQLEHGLEPLTDGGWTGAATGARPGADPFGAWRTASARSEGLVKAVVVGPYTTESDGTAERRTILELAGAGCRWIEIHEPGAVAIGADRDGRARFADLHGSLTEGLADVHLSLAITGGSADAAGIDTILAGAYASLALDLIDGPDNWRLAVATPGDRGIIAGVMAGRPDTDDGPEVLLWAAGYASSTGGRGVARVGLATSGSLAELPWDVAATKIRRLGEAAALAVATPDERLDAMDPRAVDIRSAATGRYERRPPRS